MNTQIQHLNFTHNINTILTTLTQYLTKREPLVTSLCRSVVFFALWVQTVALWVQTCPDRSSQNVCVESSPRNANVCKKKTKCLTFMQIHNSNLRPFSLCSVLQRFWRPITFHLPRDNRRGTRKHREA